MSSSLVEYLERIQAEDDERTELLRAVGGLLLGIAIFVVFIRKSSGFVEPWSDWALLALFALPALVLFGGGIAAATVAPAPRPWHAVWVAVGVLLLYAATQQMILAVDGAPEKPLNVAWVFAVIAVASLLGAQRAWVRAGYLVAGLAVAVSVYALFDELIEDGIGSDPDAFRWIGLVIALAIAGAAAMFDRNGDIDRDESSELLTASGIVFVIAVGLVSVTALFGGLIPNVAGVAPDEGLSGIPEFSLGWDIVLLLGSAALIIGANLLAVRGPIYPGIAGLAVFIVIVGSDLDSEDRDGSLIGWPLLLFVLAVGAITASVLIERTRSPE